jgi:membrane protein YdbS with pleckstrin-like domain
MAKRDLLNNEELKLKLKPHPLSFLGLQMIPTALLALGIFLFWFFNTEQTGWVKVVSDFVATPYILWLIGLAIISVIESLALIRWRIFFAHMAIFAAGMLIVGKLNWWEQIEIFAPALTIACALVGFVGVELYRQSHEYLVTNFRLIFRGGIVTRRERTLRYDKITDIDGSQGPLGRIFGFGTILPITQSGFGLGNDTAFAAGGVGTQIARGRANVNVMAGGGKEVQTPRARSYYELHGIVPYSKVKNLLEELVQESTIAPYQKEQVALQKQMVELLKKQNGMPPEGEQ